MIALYLNSSAQKLRQNFPNDPRSDIQVVYKKNIYKLQKAHLRIQSKYFHRVLSQNRGILEIEGTFNEHFFTNVLSCFYGARLQIQRLDAVNYFPIIKYLQVQALAEQLRADVIKNIQHYQIFSLFELSHCYNEQKIFEKCLRQLEQSNFSQLKNQKQNLLKTPIEIFKLIVTSHNRTIKTGINWYEIQKLILDYCSLKNLSEQDVQNLKFELIDKNNLTSKEYQNIFLKGKTKQNSPFKPFQTFSTIEQSTAEVESLKRFSLTMNAEKYQKSLTLEMQNTFHKKINEQLEQEKNKIASEILGLKSLSMSESQRSENILNQFKGLQRTMSHKQNEERYVKQKFKNIQSSLDEMQADWKKQCQKLNLLVQNTKELMDKYDQSDDKMEMSVISEGSSFFCGKDQPKQGIAKSKASNNVNQAASKAEQNASSKTKKNTFFNNYADRLFFQTLPSSIKSPEELQILLNLVLPDSFVQKNLKLVYKRSQAVHLGKQQDLRGKRSLLFLMRTKGNFLIGGKTSVKIGANAEDYVEDPEAVIFSVTRNKKFKVKKQQKSEAIMLSEGYIICFGTDLMISQKCLQEQNYCSWPSSYEGLKQLKVRGSDWLAGDSQFALTDLECYDVEQLCMEMIL